jgi:hypothetical protein
MLPLMFIMKQVFDNFLSVTSGDKIHEVTAKFYSMEVPHCAVV